MKRVTAAQSQSGSSLAAPKEQFLEEVLARLEAEPEVKSVTRGAAALTLDVSGPAGDVTTSLERLFHDTREVDPVERERRIRHHLRVLLRGLPRVDSWEQALPHLSVALRAPLAGLPEDFVLAAREVLPCLREHLVLVFEHHTALVTVEQLERWNVSYELAVASARARLARAPRTALLDDEARRIYSLETHDGYESARLLVPGFLASFAGKVRGRPIAVAPTWDQLVIAGDEDPAVVEHLCALAEREHRASPRSLSSAIYTVDARGALCRYCPEGTSASARAARATHVHFEGRAYTEQREDWAQNVFAAGFTAIDPPALGLVSCSVWPEGPGLMPRTDLVAFVKDDSWFFAPFPEVLRVAGARLKPEPGVFPPRWRAARPLSAAQLALLRKAEVKLLP